MEMSSEDAKTLADAINAAVKEVLAVHRDVIELTKRFFPTEAPAKEKPIENWPQLRTMADALRAVKWITDGADASRADIRWLRSELDVIKNDSHSYDEMKAHLIRQPPARGKGGA